jgi:hypothetical protein
MVYKFEGHTKDGGESDGMNVNYLRVFLMSLHRTQDKEWRGLWITSGLHRKLSRKISEDTYRIYFRVITLL